MMLYIRTSKKTCLLVLETAPVLSPVNPIWVLRYKALSSFKREKVNRECLPTRYSSYKSTSGQAADCEKGDSAYDVLGRCGKEVTVRHNSSCQISM